MFLVVIITTLTISCSTYCDQCTNLRTSGKILEETHIGLVHRYVVLENEADTLTYEFEHKAGPFSDYYRIWKNDSLIINYKY